MLRFGWFGRLSVGLCQAVVCLFQGGSGIDRALVGRNRLGQVPFFAVANSEQQKGLAEFGIETNSLFKTLPSFGRRSFESGGVVIIGPGILGLQPDKSSQPLREAGRFRDRAFG